MAQICAVVLPAGFTRLDEYDGLSISGQIPGRRPVEPGKVTLLCVARAETHGGTQLRLVEDAGHTLALRPIAPAPAGVKQLLELGRTLRRDSGQQWQIWTGASWFTVPGALTRPDQPRYRNC